MTLNRAAALNTVNAAMTRRLGECVRAVEADAQLRVAILTGAGEKAFCAGADLKEIVALGGKGDQLFPPGDGFGGFATLRRTKPWIAAVGGFALGGGFDLMIACDLVVAATDANARPSGSQTRRRCDGRRDLSVAPQHPTQHSAGDHPDRRSNRCAARPGSSGWSTT